METFVKEYLLEKGVKSEEQLAVHIIELKRNTVVPDIMFELVDLLVNNKDCLLSFFADNRLKEECIRIGVLPLDFPKGYKTLPQEDDYEDNFWIDFSKLVDDVVDTSKEAHNRWVKTMTGEVDRTFDFRDPRIIGETVFNDVIKDDVIFKSNIAEKETMDFLKEPYKETEGKLFYELDWDFVKQMAERMASNKENSKYDLWNWKKNMPPKTFNDLKQATMRHLIEVMEGRYEDDGRKFGHIEAISTNMMMINYQLKNEDR